MKVSKTMIVGSLMLGAIIAFSLYGIGQSIASSRYEGRDDDDYYEHRARRPYPPMSAQQRQSYALYREECGSCHMAYPPQFLPRQSWQRILGGLDDHFGENAELDSATREQLAGLLVGGPATVQWDDRRMMRNLGGAVPLRITELPHFRHEHDEIPARFVAGNDKVSSFSQCNACHRNAEMGRFDEHDVLIPGIGRWDD